MTSPDNLAATVAQGFGLELDRRPPRQGYDVNLAGNTPEGNLVQVMFGRRHEFPYFNFTGGAARLGADIMRTEYEGEHRVAEAHACYDLDAGRGTFDQITKIAQEVAKVYRAALEPKGDWFYRMEGRTLYVGSTKSRFFIRIYEKGLEQIGKLIAAGRHSEVAEISQHWVRIECVCQPRTKDKGWAATATADELFGYGRTGRDLVERVRGIAVPARSQYIRPVDDFEKSEYHMMKQWRRILSELAVREGENLAAYTLDYLKRLDREH